MSSGTSLKKSPFLQRSRGPGLLLRARIEKVYVCSLSLLLALSGYSVYLLDPWWSMVVVVSIKYDPYLETLGWLGACVLLSPLQTGTPEILAGVLATSMS